MQKHKPLVTVGIPCYNRAKGLESTLRAITSQSYKNLEIIISDNNSSDLKVKNTALSFQKVDSRIKYIKQNSNIGALNNFLFLSNKGTGKYFMWAADDDWWATNFVSEMVCLLETHKQASTAFCRSIATEDDYSLKKTYPDYYSKMREFDNMDTYNRLSCFISQKNIMGKAHICYGIHRYSMLTKAIKSTLKIVETKGDGKVFPYFDLLLIANLFSIGNLTISSKLLRRYGSGPRTANKKLKKTFAEKLISYERRKIMYYDCYLPIIQESDCTTKEKEYLEKIVKRQKIFYFLERILRRLLIYKIYWYFFKKLTFKNIKELEKYNP